MPLFKARSHGSRYKTVNSSNRSGTWHNSTSFPNPLAWHSKLQVYHTLPQAPKVPKNNGAATSGSDQRALIPLYIVTLMKTFSPKSSVASASISSHQNSHPICTSLRTAPNATPPPSLQNTSFSTGQRQDRFSQKLSLRRTPLSPNSTQETCSIYPRDGITAYRA